MNNNLLNHVNLNNLIQTSDIKSPITNEKSEIFELNKEEELRIEVNSKETIKILLLKGQAEICGVPLPFDPNHPIYVSGQKLVIFCWKESKIEIMGKPDICYIGKETPMIQYLMGYYLLHDKRIQCNINKVIGPRVLILGSKNSGKKTLIHSYLNYSIKNGYKPIYVDLSLSNEVGIPGTIAATVVDNIFPNEDFLYENSIMYFNGYCPTLCQGMGESSFSKDLFLKQIRILGNSVLEKLEYELNRFKAVFNSADIEKDVDEDTNLNYSNIPHEPQVFSSGSIIHCDSLETLDLDFYKELISSFKSDYIFILDNDRLYSMLCQEYSAMIEEKQITMIKLQKSSGVLNLDIKYKTELDTKKLNNYFLGSLRNFSLKPYELDLKQVKFLEIVSSQVDTHMLPIGKTRDLNIMVKEINLINNPDNWKNYVGRILAINYYSPKLIALITKSTDYTSLSEEICNGTVEYFAYIVKIENNKLFIETPATELDHNIFIIGSIKYK